MTVELSELSLHLGDFIKKAQSGEHVIIQAHGTDVAELHPPAKRGPRPFGIDQGKFEVTDAFFEPLPIDSSVSDIDELRSSEPRPIGLCEGQFVVTDAFFEPLPEDLLRAFNGENEDSNLDPGPPK